MAPASSQSSLLSVGVQLSADGENIVAILFPSAQHADAYQSAISKTDFHAKQDLQSKVLSDERSVAVRLPPSVTHMFSSPEYAMLFRFTEAALAEQWIENLVLWRVKKDNMQLLHVANDLDMCELNELLGLPPVPRTPGSVGSSPQRPGRISSSYNSERMRRAAKREAEAKDSDSGSKYARSSYRIKNQLMNVTSKLKNVILDKD